MALVFDNFAERVIDGKSYKFTLRNKGIFLCERALRNGNLLATIADQPFASEDLYTLFKFSAIGGGNNFNEDEMFDFFILANAELGVEGMMELIVEVLTKSGILGNAKKLTAAMKRA